MARGSVCAVAAVVMAGAMGCGQSGGSNDLAQVTVTPTAGGVLTMPDGPSMVVPPGAVIEPLTLTLTMSSVAAPAGAMSPVYSFEPAGTTFLKPATVEFQVPPSTTAATVYWTEPGTDGRYAALTTTVAGAAATSLVSRLGDGFLGAQCEEVSPCRPTDVCHVGTQTCSSGTPVCGDTGTDLPDGTACGTGNVCRAGSCVQAALPTIQLSSTGLSFVGATGGSSPAAQAVSVSNSGSGTLSSPTISVRYTSGDGWLTATPSGVSAPYTVTVQPSVAGLATGSYGANVFVACSGASNTPQGFAVTLTVQSSPMAPAIALSLASLAFTATAGGGNPSSQAVTVSNAGGGALAVPTTSIAYGTGSGWLTITTSGAAAPYTLTVQPSVGGLAAGSYGATVSVASSGASNTPQSFPVTLTVQASPTVPAIRLSSTNLAFTGRVGSSSPAPMTVTVSNSGAGALSSPTLSISYEGISGWLAVTASGSAAPYTLTLQPGVSGLAAGGYSAAVAVACSGASNTPQTIKVTLTLVPAAGVVTE